MFLDILRTSRFSDESIRGRLVLVDLVNFERVYKTDVSGARLLEARHISKSLVELGAVMAALSAKENHVPFRNCKLTHLLQHSLDQVNKVLMLVHVSPSPDDKADSINTLKFASRQFGRSEQEELERQAVVMLPRTSTVSATSPPLAPSQRKEAAIGTTG